MMAWENAVEDDTDNDDQANITLPASFMGLHKWASEQTAGSLALA